MPLRSEKIGKPFAEACLARLGMSDNALSKRCGVHHTQIWTARNYTVRKGNAEKIASFVARELGLSAREKLELKAEIMGRHRRPGAHPQHGEPEPQRDEMEDAQCRVPRLG